MSYRSYRESLYIVCYYFIVFNSMRWYDFCVEEGIEKLLTVEELMKTLRISRPTLYRLLKSGKLEPVRIGKRVLFETKDIKAFIERSKGGAKESGEQKKPKRERQKRRAKQERQDEPQESQRPQKAEKTRKSQRPKEQEEPPATQEDTHKQGRLL